MYIESIIVIIANENTCLSIFSETKPIFTRAILEKIIIWSCRMHVQCVHNFGVSLHINTEYNMIVTDVAEREVE